MITTLTSKALGTLENSNTCHSIFMIQVNGAHNCLYHTISALTTLQSALTEMRYAKKIAQRKKQTLRLTLLPVSSQDAQGPDLSFLRKIVPQEMRDILEQLHIDGHPCQSFCKGKMRADEGKRLATPR